MQQQVNARGFIVSSVTECHCGNVAVASSACVQREPARQCAFQRAQHSMQQHAGSRGGTCSSTCMAMYDSRPQFPLPRGELLRPLQGRRQRAPSLQLRRPVVYVQRPVLYTQSGTLGSGRALVQPEAPKGSFQPSPITSRCVPRSSFQGSKLASEIQRISLHRGLMQNEQLQPPDVPGKTMPMLRQPTVAIQPIHGITDTIAPTQAQTPLPTATPTTKEKYDSTVDSYCKWTGLRWPGPSRASFG